MNALIISTQTFERVSCVLGDDLPMRSLRCGRITYDVLSELLRRTEADVSMEVLELRLDIRHNKCCDWSFRNHQSLRYHLVTNLVGYCNQQGWLVLLRGTEDKSSAWLRISYF